MSDFSKLKTKKNGKEYILNVCTQDTEQNITGTKNFSKLTVNGKNIVRSVNGVNADTSGNVTITADSTVSLKGRRTSTGTWTITGLTPYKPLIIIYDVAESITCGIRGVTNCTTNATYLYIGEDRGMDNNHIVLIPTSSNVSITLDGTVTTARFLEAYQ